MSAVYAYDYLRLSDEEFKSGESSSIQNQRTAIQQYCKNHGITLIREFVDDGYSGSNFDRPGFTKMLQYLQRKEVTMVLTKDLSRLGRDMRESSYYAETFFPENGIHYIAINDNFDSEQENTLAPFQFAMNDVYLRDTSKKVRTILTAKKKAGEYAACPPFGYKRDPSDKTKLVPDETTAPIVQEIFSLASQGQSTRTICDHLNAQGSIPPLKYRVLNGGEFSPEGAARAADAWNYVTVKRILRNEVYLGHTLLNRSRKVSLKAKRKVDLDRSEWIITRDTHPPLVTQEEFDLAQEHLKTATKQWQQYDQVRHSIFGGVAYCAHCGTAMCSAGTVYNGEREKYWYLQCNNLPKRSAKRCEHPGRIKYSDLVELVRLELNDLIDLSEAEIDSIIQKVQSETDGEQARVKRVKDINTLKHRQQQIDDMITKLYQDNVEGKLADDRLERMVKTLEEESRGNDQKIAVLEAEGENTVSVVDNYNRFFQMVRDATHIDTLTEEIVKTFIQRIEISERELPPGVTIAGPRTPYKQEIRIFYRFIGEITEDPVREVHREQRKMG